MIKAIKNFSFGGKLLVSLGLLTMLPLIVLIFEPQDAKYAYSFLIAGGASILIGAFVGLLTGKKETVRRFNNLFMLALWLYVFVLGATPFFIASDLNFVQSLFESVSGYTSTGLSVINVEATPKIFLFHRALTEAVGGWGFMIFFIFFSQSKRSASLFQAEGHQDNIMPSIKQTATAILIIYLILIALGTILYVIFNVPFFDALTTSMCAVATGGFSVKNASIAAYNSLPAEFITMLLMLAGATTFAIYVLIGKRKVKRALKTDEFKLMLIIIGVATLISAISLSTINKLGFWYSLRVSVFSVVSAISTAGFSIFDFSLMPQICIVILIVMMIFGGCSGSTAGAVKLNRIVIATKTLKKNLVDKVSSQRRVTVSYYYRTGEKIFIDGVMVKEAFCFIVSYLGILLVGATALTLTSGCTIGAGLFEFASSMGTVGISIGLTNNATGAGTLIVEMFGMLAGRLEIFIILLGVYEGVQRLLVRPNKRVEHVENDNGAAASAEAKSVVDGADGQAAEQTDAVK